jgi:hypothetical protein
MWRESVRGTTHVISDAVEQWLSAEYVSASAGSNKHLDDLVRLQAGLTLPPDDPLNVNAAKNRSHTDRHRHYVTAFLDRPYRSTTQANLVFNLLMQLSAGQRLMCYLRSSNEAEYKELRHGPNSSGIDLENFVGAVAEEYAEAPVGKINQKRVLASGLHIFKIMGICQPYLSERAAKDIGQQASPLLEFAHLLQVGRAEALTRHILYFADLHGGSLASVPALEPKSITENPGLIYPFAL